MKFSKTGLSVPTAVAGVFLATYLVLGDDLDRSAHSPPDQGEGLQIVRQQRSRMGDAHSAEPADLADLADLAEHSRTVASAAQIDLDRQVESLMASSEAQRDSLETDRLELSRLHMQESALLKEELLKAMRSPELQISSEDFNERPQSDESVVYVTVRRSGGTYHAPIMRENSPELFSVRDKIRELELKPANRERLELKRILEEDALLNSIKDR